MPGGQAQLLTQPETGQTTERGSWKVFFGHKTHSNHPRKLPRPVQDYMKRRFLLLPEYLETLRCFEYDGLINQKEVRCIRIFSLDTAREHHLEIRTSLDLERHPELLVFIGHIDYQGQLYIADRRAPLKQVRVS